MTPYTRIPTASDEHDFLSVLEHCLVLNAMHPGDTSLVMYAAPQVYIRASRYMLGNERFVEHTKWPPSPLYVVGVMVKPYTTTEEGQ